MFIDSRHTIISPPGWNQSAAWSPSPLTMTIMHYHITLLLELHAAVAKIGSSTRGPGPGSDTLLPTVVLVQMLGRFCSTNGEVAQLERDYRGFNKPTKPSTAVTAIYRVVWKVHPVVDFKTSRLN